MRPKFFCLFGVGDVTKRLHQITRGEEGNVYDSFCTTSIENHILGSMQPKNSKLMIMQYAVVFLIAMIFFLEWSGLQFDFQSNLF